MAMNSNYNLFSSSCDPRPALSQLLYKHVRLINSRLFSSKRGAFVVPRTRNFRVQCESQTKELQTRKFSPVLESVFLSGNGVLPSNEWKTVPDIWRTSAEKFGDRVALVDPYHNPPTNMTYKQIDSGLMTPTMKIRRDRVVSLYKDQIKDLYKQSA